MEIADVVKIKFEINETEQHLVASLIVVFDWVHVGKPLVEVQAGVAALQELDSLVFVQFLVNDPACFVADW